MPKLLTCTSSDGYAGTSNSGVYYSNDNGMNWVADNIGLPLLYTTCISGNNSVVYVGTARGLFKSNINSHIWTPITGIANFYYFKGLAVDGDTIFAATSTDGLFKSYNAGLTWENAYEVSKGNSVTALAVSDNYIFASEPSYGRFYRSADQGNTWDCTVEISFRSLFINNNRLYGGNLKTAGVSYSDDNGSTWTNSNSGLSGNVPVQKFMILNNSLFILKDYIYKSTDNGISWSKLNINNNAIPLVSLVKLGNTLFTSNYQGVYESNDLGATWNKLSINLPVGEMCYDVAAGNNMLFLNTVDNIYQSSDKGVTWKVIYRNNMPNYSFNGIEVLDDQLIAYPFIWNQWGDRISKGMYLYSDTTWKFLNNAIPYPGCLLKHKETIWAGVWPGVVKVSNDLVIGIKNNVTDQEDIMIYPNPFSDHINIDLKANSTIKTIKIFNLLGQEVYSKKYNSFNTHESIDLSSEPKGIYFVEINTTQKETIKKIVLQ